MIKQFKNDIDHIISYKNAISDIEKKSFIIEKNVDKSVLNETQTVNDNDNRTSFSQSVINNNETVPGVRGGMVRESFISQNEENTNLEEINFRRPTEIENKTKANAERKIRDEEKKQDEITGDRVIETNNKMSDNMNAPEEEKKEKKDYLLE